MRLKYSKKDFMSTYKHLVRECTTEYNNGNIDRTIDLLKCTAEYQYNLNYIFSDKVLENIICDMSRKLSCKIKDYQPKRKRIILYDYFVYDNRGLTQQYLDALCFESTYEVLLLHDTVFSSSSINTLRYCKEHGIITKELGTGRYNERKQRLINIVNEFCPEKVLLHLYPSNVLPLEVFGAYNNIIKYQINLTDHAFWLGSQTINYSFEFRNLGCSLSVRERNLKPEQILLLPYYPWQENVHFQGFPPQAEGKVILFGGGSLYKIEGANDEFLIAVKKILDASPNAVMIYAGSGNFSYIKNFITSNNLEERFLLLGNRKDIDQVFKHSDIYINTYPVTGALMGQFAAINSMPILSFKDKGAEDEICTKKHASFVFEDLDALVKEGIRLVKDEKYRKERGHFFNRLVSTREDFCNSFSKQFSTNISSRSITLIPVNYHLYDPYPQRINNGEIGLELEQKILKISPDALCWKMKFNINWKLFRHKIHVARLKITGKLV